MDSVPRSSVVLTTRLSEEFTKPREIEYTGLGRHHWMAGLGSLSESFCKGGSVNEKVKMSCYHEIILIV